MYAKETELLNFWHDVANYDHSKDLPKPAEINEALNKEFAEIFKKEYDTGN